MAFADLVLNPKQFPLNYSFNTDDVNFPLENLRLLGIMGLMDPPREEVSHTKTIVFVLTKWC